MIGNDIIDLQASRRESNWQRKGWLQKIFTEQEQHFIKDSATPEIMVWLFWSMKEAAYKISNRISRKQSYAPLAFHCSVKSLQKGIASGSVLHRDVHYPTQSTWSDSYIHTIAQTSGTRKKLHISISHHPDSTLELPLHFTLLKDSAGIPYLLHSLTGQTLDASLSHHGHYLALAY